jgi:mRNA interferase RelE/StbE
VPEYEVRLQPEAARAYRRLHEPMLGRIRSAIEGLGTDPRPSGAVRLAGRDDYRIRVGDYRVVYAIDDGTHEVLAARIAHRREVYRR